MTLYQSIKKFTKSIFLVGALTAVVAYAAYKNHSFLEKEVVPKIKSGIEKVIDLDNYLESKSPEPVKKINEWQRKNIYDPILGTDSRDAYKKK